VHVSAQVPAFHSIYTANGYELDFLSFRPKGEILRSLTFVRDDKNPNPNRSQYNLKKCYQETRLTTSKTPYSMGQPAAESPLLISGMDCIKKINTAYNRNIFDRFALFSNIISPQLRLQKRPPQTISKREVTTPSREGYRFAKSLPAPSYLAVSPYSASTHGGGRQKAFRHGPAASWVPLPKQ
jgi:hypothetical protein